MTAYENKCLYLLEQGPLTFDELLGEIKIPAGSLKGVLADLRRDGLVKCTTYRNRGIGSGSGRGKGVYEAVDPLTTV